MIEIALTRSMHIYKAKDSVGLPAKNHKGKRTNTTPAAPVFKDISQMQSSTLSEADYSHLPAPYFSEEQWREWSRDFRTAPATGYWLQMLWIWSRHLKWTEQQPCRNISQRHRGVVWYELALDFEAWCGQEIPMQALPPALGPRHSLEEIGVRMSRMVIDGERIS